MSKGRNDNPERLAPHSLEAERGVLGCCLLRGELVGKARERFESAVIGMERGSGLVFYDLRHRKIWQVLLVLFVEGVAIDLITVRDRLGAAIHEVGGLASLSQLQDDVPSTEHLSDYVAIVWEKFLARVKLQESIETARTIFESGGLTEGMIGLIARRQKEFDALAQAGSVTPQHLAAPRDFGEEFFDRWLHRRHDKDGWELPVPMADLRLRPYEFTVMTAESGAGKSTFLGHLAVHLGAQEVRTMIASLEEPVVESLWMMSRQAMGAASMHVAETAENMKRLHEVLEWLQKWMRFYNFLGIGQWRQILDVFRYVRQAMGWEVFIFDSMAKAGIAEDDLAQQGMFAQAFADFCLSTGAHGILVVHQNKSEGTVTKKKVRGVGTITDVANVILSLRRNEKKDEKIEELDYRQQQEEAVLRRKDLVEADKVKAHEALRNIKTARWELRLDWDTDLRMLKQRSKGAQYQNASRKLYFDRQSLQFRKAPPEPIISYV